ncbi:hypothetical protein RCL1_001555 [Eukaryota sp. TZLM3-RCL]
MIQLAYSNFLLILHFLPLNRLLRYVTVSSFFLKSVVSSIRMRSSLEFSSRHLLHCFTDSAFSIVFSPSFLPDIIFQTKVLSLTCEPFPLQFHELEFLLHFPNKPSVNLVYFEIRHFNRLASRSSSLVFSEFSDENLEYEVTPHNTKIDVIIASEETFSLIKFIEWLNLQNTCHVKSFSLVFSRNNDDNIELLFNVIKNKFFSKDSTLEKFSTLCNYNYFDDLYHFIFDGSIIFDHLKSINTNHFFDCSIFKFLPNLFDLSITPDCLTVDFHFPLLLRGLVLNEVQSKFDMNLIGKNIQILGNLEGFSLLNCAKISNCLLNSIPNYIYSLEISSTTLDFNTEFKNFDLKFPYLFSLKLYSVVIIIEPNMKFSRYLKYLSTTYCTCRHNTKYLCENCYQALLLVFTANIQPNIPYYVSNIKNSFEKL